MEKQDDLREKEDYYTAHIKHVFNNQKYLREMFGDDYLAMGNFQVLYHHLDLVTFLEEVTKKNIDCAVLGRIDEMIVGLG